MRIPTRSVSMCPQNFALPLLSKHPVVKVEVTVPEDVIGDRFLFAGREIQYLSCDHAEVKWHKFRDSRPSKRKGWNRVPTALDIVVERVELAFDKRYIIRQLRLMAASS
jgi:hypothetical protein